MLPKRPFERKCCLRHATLFERRSANLVGGSLLGDSGRSFTETVLEFTWDGLEVLHATSALGTATKSLLRPVELAHLGSWVTTRRADALLHVVGATSTTTADGVGLVVTLTERLGTFSHLEFGLRPFNRPPSANLG